MTIIQLNLILDHGFSTKT